MAKLSTPKPTKLKPIKKKRNMYFDNPLVESLLREYVLNGCVHITLRNEIMSHAGELIRQVIRTHGLDHTYGGGESSFHDLFQVAWVQIEKTLYKFDYSEIFTLACMVSDKKRKYKIRGCVVNRNNEYITIRLTRDNIYDFGGNEITFKDGCLMALNVNSIVSRRYDNTKAFNMWSQVVKTVVLAYIKKETRDKKNYNNYSGYLKYRPIGEGKKLSRFLEEAKSFSNFDDEELQILSSIANIAEHGLESASNGLVSKIQESTNLSRMKIVSYLKKLRQCQSEFTDSPTNTEKTWIGNPGGSTRKYNIDDEDW